LSGSFIRNTSLKGISAFCENRIEAWSLMRISDENFLLIRQEPTEGGEVASVKTMMRIDVLKSGAINEIFGVKTVQAFVNGEFECLNDEIIWK
jgi:hypothetical protein